VTVGRNHSKPGGSTVSNFSPKEIEYLGSGLLGRLATVGLDGTPHVAPVGMISYNAQLDTIDVRGHDLANTKKFRDVARSGRAALVVDDLASTDPWRPRGIEVRGRAEAVEGPQPLIRIYPERIVAWGIGSGGFRRNSRSVGVAYPNAGTHEREEKPIMNAVADRLLIIELLGKHQITIDLGNANAHAELYAPDGRFESPFATARAAATATLSDRRSQSVGAEVRSQGCDSWVYSL
jgi:pyridoxamine 5'-phosphate oxidase family protein